MLILLVASGLNAQWRLGVTGGGSINWNNIDFGYATTYKQNSKMGGTVMVSGQYNFNDWIGLRVDAGWVQRNYERTLTTKFSDGTVIQKWNFKRNYLMLPVTASFSCGGENFRGYIDLGGFAGYWLSQKTIYDSGEKNSQPVTEKYVFNDKRDVRFDAGLVGRIGGMYTFDNNMFINLELTDYMGMVNMHKTGSEYIKQNAYDNTLSIQVGIGYTFK